MLPIDWRVASLHPPSPQIAAVGVDTYLKMLLQDNFVHLDLHPGNIMARLADVTGGSHSTGFVS